MAGGLYYPNQTPVILIGSKSGTTRTGIEMESTYQAESATEATQTFETGGYPRMELHILYTMGSTESGNSIQVILESTTDGTNFYRLPNDTTSTDTSTITEREFTYVGTTNAGDSEIVIGLDIAYTKMRVSFQETGVTTNKGSVYCETLFSGL